MRNLVFLSLSTLFLMLSGSTWIAFFPFLPDDLGGAENLDRRARRVRIPLPGGDALDGWYVKGTRPAAVLLLHGYGRNHLRMWRYGEFLTKQGYGVLAIDFRSAREGRRLPTTLGHHEQVDAQAALDWLRAEVGPETRLGVLGESLGASVAMLVSARNPDVAAVVEDCGFASGRLALEDSVQRWAHLPRWPTAPVLRWVGRQLTGYDAYAIDVVQAASALSDRPVLFIQGLEDNRFSPAQVRELWQAAGSKDPLWLIPGTGHNGGWRNHRDDYEGRVLAFLDRHLLGTGRGVRAGALDGMPVGGLEGVPVGEFESVLVGAL